VVTANRRRYRGAAHANCDDGAQPGLRRLDTVAKVVQRAVLRMPGQRSC